MKFRGPRTAAALACTVSLALAGCSYLAPLLPASMQPPPAAPPPVVSPSGLAPITDEQVERILEEIATNPPTPGVAKIVRSAAPTIERPRRPNRRREHMVYKPRGGERDYVKSPRATMPAARQVIRDRKPASAVLVGRAGHADDEVAHPMPRGVP